MNKALLSLVLILFFISCKKYEEGPALSFRSKNARLENSWKYEKILLNADEQVITEEDKKFKLRFDKEGLAIKEIYNASGAASYVGDYTFNDHKEKLQTTFDYSYFGNPVHEVIEYTILKLKNKELWLEEIKASGDTCEYHFIPE
jgi:hypothetical protein